MKRPVIIGLLILALGLVCLGIGAVTFFRLSANSPLAGNSPFDTRNISSHVEESKTIKVDSAKPVTDSPLASDCSRFRIALIWAGQRPLVSSGGRCRTFPRSVSGSV